MISKSITELEQNNEVNLCNSCEHEYPDCPQFSEVVFGTGVGNDNICACNEYVPIRTRKQSI